MTMITLAMLWAWSTLITHQLFPFKSSVYKHYYAPAEWNVSPKSLDSLPVFMPRWDETRQDWHSYYSTIKARLFSYFLTLSSFVEEFYEKMGRRRCRLSQNAIMSMNEWVALDWCHVKVSTFIGAQTSAYESNVYRLEGVRWRDGKTWFNLLHIMKRLSVTNWHWLWYL